MPRSRKSEIESTLDMEILDFYFNLFKILRNSNTGEACNKDFIRGIPRKAKKPTESKNSNYMTNSEKPNDYPEDGICEVYKSSVCTSSAVMFHFKNLMADNTQVLKKMSYKAVLNICSIGARTAADIVGIVKALEQYRKNSSLDIRITIVCIDEDYKNLCMCVLQLLDLCKEDRRKINFLQADLLVELEDDVMKAAFQADIVSVVRVFSESELDDEKQIHFFQELCKNMGHDSLLFVLDGPSEGVVTCCGGHKGQIEDFQLIYEEANELHTLDASALEKSCGRFRKRFGKCSFSSSMKVFARCWTKTPDASVAIDSARRFDGRRSGSFDPGECLKKSNFGKAGKDLEKKLNEKTRKVQLARSELLASNRDDGQSLVRRCEWRNYTNAKDELAKVKLCVYNRPLGKIVSAGDQDIAPKTKARSF